MTTNKKRNSADIIINLTLSDLICKHIIGMTRATKWALWAGFGLRATSLTLLS